MDCVSASESSRSPKAVNPGSGLLFCMACLLLGRRGCVRPMMTITMTSESSINALLEAVGEGVALVSPSGEVVFCNELFRALDAAAIDRISTVCRGLNKSALSARGVGTPPSQGPWRVETSASDGSRWYGVTIAPVVKNGISLHYSVVVRDITPERAFRQKVEAIDRAGSDLLSFDAETVRRMHPVDRLRMAEEKITRYAKELLHFDHFAVRILEEKTGKLQLTIQHGMPPEFGDIDIYAKAEGNGISGYVAATGQSYVCNDTSSDPLFLPGLAGARSSLTVPLKLADRTIGIMNIESREGTHFSDEDRLFAEMFTRYVALALHTLDLLVVERSNTNEVTSKRVETEVGKPLDQLIQSLGRLTAALADGRTDETAAHLELVRSEVEDVRDRARGLAAGSQTVFAADFGKAKPVAEALLDRKRVLIADDEPRVRKIIGDILRHHGCEVTIVDSGSSAIAALEAASRQEIPNFDLVLSDIKMPDKTGYEVFSAARASRADLPVILMTGFGYDPHHSIVRASQNGCKQVLFKPFEAALLLDEVRKALSQPVS